jgi:L-rhamnose mutarotase
MSTPAPDPAGVRKHDRATIHTRLPSVTLPVDDWVRVLTPGRQFWGRSEMNNVHRVASLMRLKPGSEEEYERRHQAVWPELLELLTETGIRNYSIYRNGLDLYSYLEIDRAGDLDALAENPVMRRWWQYMEPLMEYNPDSTPQQTSIQEVFHLD